MKKLIVVFLTASVTANAWMLIRQPQSEPALEAPRPKPGMPSLRANLSHAAAEMGAKLLAQIDTTELAAQRDALRAEGMDDASVRAVIGGVLRARHRERLAAWRVDRLRNAWWLGGISAPGGSGAPSQRELVHEPLRALLGPDPLDIADAEARYDFLSQEKRLRLALIDLDYSELRSRLPRGAQSNAATKGEQAEAELLARERQEDLLAALTPEERAEYDLRFEGTAVQNARRFAAMHVTEQEFRALKPIIDAYRNQSSPLPRNPDTIAARTEIDQRTLDQLVAVVGYPRALDYVWSMHIGHRDTADLLREQSLPPGNASRLFQLAAETGAKAAAIHANPSLSEQQRQTALLGLQQASRPQFDGLVPVALQGRLPPHAREWFTMLGDGSYKVLMPVLVGAGYSESSPIRVTAPPRKLALWASALPRLSK